jgi:hypothetical protein
MILVDKKQSRDKVRPMLNSDPEGGDEVPSRLVQHLVGRCKGPWRRKMRWHCISASSHQPGHWNFDDAAASECLFALRLMAFANKGILLHSALKGQVVVHIIR